MHPRLKAFLLFILFVVVSQALEGGLAWALLLKLGVIDTHDLSWRPSAFIWFESVVALAVITAAFVVAKLQHGSLSQLGFGLPRAGRLLLEGSLFGIATLAVLIVAVSALGGFAFGSLAMHGQRLAAYAGAWLFAFFLLGLAEEATFRASYLYILGQATGVWPAAIISSVVFAAIHYFGKPHENVADALSVGVIGFFLCVSVIRTGSIWFAVGFHALFDYVALFVLGAPNSGNHGQPVATKLLNGGFHGPLWLTGGPLGVEASWLVFPVMGLVFIVFGLRHYNRAVPVKEKKEEFP